MKEQDIPKQIFCFDFDGTILKQDIRKRLSKNFNIMTLPILTTYTSKNDAKLNEQYEEIKSYLSELKCNIKHKIYNPDLFTNAFNTLIKQGHKVFITSLSAYPGLIKLTLENLELTEEILEQITILSGVIKEEDHEETGKNTHITEIKKMLMIETINNNLITLIDDDHRCVWAAEKKGYNTLHVTPHNLEQSILNLLTYRYETILVQSEFEVMHLNNLENSIDNINVSSLSELTEILSHKELSETDLNSTQCSSLSELNEIPSSNTLLGHC